MCHPYYASQSIYCVGFSFWKILRPLLYYNGWLIEAQIVRNMKRMSCSEIVTRPTAINYARHSCWGAS